MGPLQERTRQPHGVRLSGVREEVAGMESLSPPWVSSPTSQFLPTVSYLVRRSPHRSCSHVRCGRPAWPAHRSGCPAEPETKCTGTPFTQGQPPCHVSSHHQPKSLSGSCQHLASAGTPQALLQEWCPARGLRGRGLEGTSIPSPLCVRGAGDGGLEGGAKRQSCPRRERTAEDPALAGCRELRGAGARLGR